VEHNNDNTAAVASIEDVADCTARADAQVRSVLREVMAQRRSVAAAFGYVAALSPGTKANCWSLAEAAGHEGWGRMQGLPGSYRWDWAGLRAALPALAVAWIPGAEQDLIGLGIAIDETAQLKHAESPSLSSEGQRQIATARQSREVALALLARPDLDEEARQQVLGRWVLSPRNACHQRTTYQR
jgi:hypothetical protein